MSESTSKSTGTSTGTEHFILSLVFYKIQAIVRKVFSNVRMLLIRFQVELTGTFAQKYLTRTGIKKQ